MNEGDSFSSEYLRGRQGAGNPPEIQVRVGTWLHPAHLAAWIRALSNTPASEWAVNVGRRGVSEGNDINIWGSIRINGVRWRLWWNTGVDPYPRSQPEWYRGRDFINNVGFIKSREERLLTPSEVDSLLAWAEKDQVPGRFPPSPLGGRVLPTMTARPPGHQHQRIGADQR